MTDSPKIHATSTGVINRDYKQGNLIYLLLLCKRFGYHLLLSEVRFTGSGAHGYNYTTSVIQLYGFNCCTDFKLYHGVLLAHLSSKTY